MARDKFWMVLGNGTPTYRHPAKSTAVAEAERLARMNPGTEFVVLESLAVCKKTEVLWEATSVDNSESDHVPF